MRRRSGGWLLPGTERGGRPGSLAPVLCFVLPSGGSQTATKCEGARGTPLSVQVSVCHSPEPWGSVLGGLHK